MSLKPFIIDGQECWTGLQLPEKRPEQFVSYADAGYKIKSKDEIAKLINSKRRTSRRKRFDPAKFIRRQINNGCNGFAGAAALTRARILRGLPPVMLSGDGLYAQISGNRDDGSALANGMRVMMSAGIPPEQFVKVGIYRSSSLTAEAREAMGRFKGTECWGVDTEAQLASGLADGFIGVVAVHVGGSYSKLDSNGVRGTSTGAGNHAVCVQDVRIVGSEYQFDEVGSWGLGNGQQGHAWLTWARTLRSTVRNHRFYLIGSTTDDSQSDNPPAPKGT